jgi:hypothetical protein
MTRSWRYRRLAVFASLLGAIAGLGYLIVWGEDTTLHRQIADGLIWVVGWVLAVYVGGSTLDDGVKDYLSRRDP